MSNDRSDSSLTAHGSPYRIIENIHPSAPPIELDNVNREYYYYGGISHSCLRFIALIIAVHGAGVMFISSLYYTSLLNFKQHHGKAFGDGHPWENLALTGIVFGILNLVTSVSALAMWTSPDIQIPSATKKCRQVSIILYYITSTIAMTTLSIWLLSTEAYKVQKHKIYKAGTALIILSGSKSIGMILFGLYAAFSKPQDSDQDSTIRQDPHYTTMVHLKSSCEHFQGVFRSSVLLVIIGSTLFLTIWSSLDPLVQDVRCPGNIERYNPCTCDDLWGEVRCEGKEVTQESINQMFMALRQANNVSTTTQMLNLVSFYITQTKLERLDLSFLSSMSFSHILSISQNEQLTTILNSTYNSKIMPKSYVDLSENSLDDQGLSSILYHFTPTMKSLYLNGNKIQGSVYSPTQTKEFLPGLSQHIQLEELYLDSNNIRQIAGGQFKRNKRLKRIQLSGNRINDIGERAFEFDLPDTDMTDQILTIDLRNNLLQDSVISPAAAFQSTGRSTSVYLDGNQFKFISEKNFLKFLSARNSNFLSLFGNSIFCDDNMKWVKLRKGDLEGRVVGLECTNDKGKTVFDTDLISAGNIIVGNFWTVLVTLFIIFISS